MSDISLRSAKREFVQRQHRRSAVALPAIIVNGSEQCGARILDIAPGGALIQCSADFRLGASFLLRCGSIAVESVVVWGKGNLYGLNFGLPLSEAEVTEQLVRHKAIDSRRLLKGQLRSPRNGALTTSLVGKARGSTPSTAHLWAIEASHQQVESCLVTLETIMAGELTDISRFSTARLRLRQANLARTKVGLEACRHLMTIDPSQAALGDLQRRELDVSQMISAHVHNWPMQTLRGDWDGYCRATRKILSVVRDLIIAEKKLLCCVLQRRSLHQW